MAVSTIWVGDLVRVVRVAAPANDSTRQAIADLLGFDPIKLDPGPPDQGPSPRPTSAATPVAPAAVTATTAMFVDTIRMLAPVVTARVRSDERNYPLTLEPSEPTATPPAVPSLLSPLASRFILHELVLTTRFGPDPDVDRVISALSRLEIPQPVPLLEHRTLARGVQVLVDRGEGMEPFAADQDRVVHLLELLIGKSLVDLRPIHEVPDPKDPTWPWEPPAPGTPVLVLTDLGLGGRSDRNPNELKATWRRIATELASRSSAVVALIPYPRTQWPTELRGVMRIVMWDRPTTVGRARITRVATGTR